jgi:hypothetical protein
MKAISTAIALVCVGLAGGGAPGRAQAPADYCQTLTMLMQSAKTGFGSVAQFKMPGASICSVDAQTRSYGCMWNYQNAGAATRSYQQAVQAVQRCFPAAHPRSSHSERGTLHTEYDFGRDQPLIDLSRSAGQRQGAEWYSIDVVAP